jgi:hypothetical protein
MKFRFIEYQSDIYIVVGIGYNELSECKEYFECIPLRKHRLNLFELILDRHTINIEIDKAKEITDKKRLLTLLVLYG